MIDPPVLSSPLRRTASVPAKALPPRLADPPPLERRVRAVLLRIQADLAAPL